MHLPCHASGTNGGDSPALHSFLAHLFHPFSKVGQSFVSRLVLAGSGLAFCATAHAQSSATIEGQIIDPDGAAVPAVQIVATNAETSTTRRTITDDSGRYRLVALSLGTYRVEVTGGGFQKQLSESLTLTI